MGPADGLPGDEVWDLERLRLPAGSVGDLSGRERPPRHRPGEPFIRGPIPFAWVASACRLPGAGLPVAMAFRFLYDRFQAENRWGLDAVARGLGISVRSAQRGLAVAELAGLLTAEREPGCKLAGSVRERSGRESGRGRRPLYGPIPWVWWLPASRLAGKSPQVAAACWLLAGWERTATFELGLAGWADLGLTRFAARRGLECLERAGLVSVESPAGRKPLVTLLDAPGTPACRSGDRITDVAPASLNDGPRSISV